jgi:septum formation protein
MTISSLDLVLVSTSRYRRELMDRLGVPYRWRAPLVDEESLKDRSLDPAELSLVLAEAKARSVLIEEPASTLIGCDQVVSFEGAILGKPGDAARAVQQLGALAGRWHEIVTSLVVVHEGESRRHTDRTRLKLRDLTPAELDAIVAADRSWDCAGGYKIEGRGTWLFDRVETEDPSAIIGLPLFGLVTILRDLGLCATA